jgi:hypothetical protein
MTTQRTLRCKRGDLRKCLRIIRDADFVAEHYKKATILTALAIQEGQDVQNHILEKLIGQKTEQSIHQDPKQKIGFEIEHLERRADK